MPPADTEVVEALPKEEIVPSQEKSEHQVEIPVPEISEEEKERRRKNAQIRLQNKAWKNKLREIQNSDLSEDEMNAVLNTAKNSGYDTTSEDVKKQAKLIAESAVTIQKSRDARTGKVLLSACNQNLAETLERLGYQPKTEAFLETGNFLFRKFGTSDPSLFEDGEKMESAIRDFQSSFLNKKPESTVEKAVMAKAGSPKPTSESRTVSQAAAAANEVKQIAVRMGISPERAARIIEKTKNLSPRLRPKF